MPSNLVVKHFNIFEYTTFSLFSGLVGLLANTKQGGLYLATIIDLYSRKVVGWSMGSANDTALVSEALQMAIKNKPKQQKVLLHSDQESTYRAYEYLKLFKANSITQSMSGKGECHDNAVAESFFRTESSGATMATD
jgi:putative transposase